MSDSLPSLSVVIPNHNYGHWIADAINSVANDPYPNKRILVVDDGSTDSSWEVICNLSDIPVDDTKEEIWYNGCVAGCQIFCYRRKEAGGPSVARNTGIKASWDYSDFYGFLDADDQYLLGKIEESLKVMMLDINTIGACYTDYDTINIETGQRTRCYKEPFSKPRLQQECIVHSSCVVSRNALETCGIYDETMRTAEDWGLWLRIAERFMICHIAQPLMLVRTGSYNSTGSVPRSVWDENWKKIGQQIAEQRGH